MIAKRPHAVWWLVGGTHYSLCEIRAAEMARLRAEYPDMLGIPTCYAIINDDVEWWPQSMQGEFVLVMPEAHAGS